MPRRRRRRSARRRTTARRGELLDRATEAAERTGHRHERLRGFLGRYYRHVPVEDLAEREPLDLAGAALSHRQLAAQRPQGTANVRVFTPTVDEYGWTSGHTVVEIVTDDMPFLVDSVTTELSRQERGIHLLVHPQVVVRRDVTGRLLEVLEVSATDWAKHDHPRDSLVESWIHVEIDRETDPERREEILTGVRSVLEDVRVAVEDWPKMKQRAREIAAELAASPPAGLPEEEVAEGRALLEWLAEDHFTFLGYRDYRLVERDGRDTLVARTGSGLGILRYDQQHNSPSFDRLTPQARAKARERQLLVLTTANTRATVHRAAYLDYIGSSSSTPPARSSGSGASSGCSPPAPTPTASAGSRWSGARCRRCWTAPASAPTATPARTCCRSSRPTRATSCSRSPSRTCRPPSSPSCTCRSGGAPGCSCASTTTAATCRAWCSCRATGTRRRCGSGWRRSCAPPSTRDGRLQRPGQRERAGPPPLRRPRSPPGAELPDVDRDDLERRLVEATRSWDEDLADALRADLGEEEAARLLRVWGRGFPEAYKEDFPARVAVADLRRIEALDAGPVAPLRHEPLRARRRLGGRAALQALPAAPLSLTDVLPYLGDLGAEVVDERPYEIRRADGESAWVYDFGLRYTARRPAPRAAARAVRATRSPRPGAGAPRATASPGSCCSAS